MYKGSSQGAQRHLHRLSVGDAIKASGHNTPQDWREEAENLRRALGDLDYKISRLPRGSKAREILVIQKQELQTKRVALKAARTASRPQPDTGRVHVLFRKLVEDKLGSAAALNLWEEAKAAHRAEGGFVS